MKLFPKAIGCTVGAVLLSTIATTEAKAITLFFDSFEGPSLNDGEFTTSIPGWSGSGGFGVYNPSPTVYNEPVPGGSNVAYLNGASISTSVGSNLESDLIYTLSVFVGNRLDTAFPNYTVALLAGGNVLDSGSTPVGDGQFEQFQLSYSAPAGSSFIGQALTIQLSNGGTQTNFDLVTLDATPIPFEFSPSLGLLALGSLWGSSHLYKRMTNNN